MNDHTPSVALVRGLQALQARDGLKSPAFAQKLGISRTVWFRMCQAAEAGDLEKLNTQIGKTVIFAIRRNAGIEVQHLLDAYLALEPDSVDREPALRAVG